jgi:hypothetical protein
MSLSSRPVTGESGSHWSDTNPSAIQAASRGARSARAIHSRARPTSPCWISSSSAIIMAARWVGAAASGTSAARGRKLLRIERGLGASPGPRTGAGEGGSDASVVDRKYVILPEGYDDKPWFGWERARELRLALDAALGHESP